MNEKALEIVDLCYSYKSDWSSKRFPALKGINLEVAEGESFGFLGHNGAGKTTTIKCILGLIRANSGSINIFGSSHDVTAARRSTGYLPEQPYFYDHLRVSEIMEMYAALAGVPAGSARKQAIKEALERVQVSAKAETSMRALSKGLTQRVAMAQAIVGKPKLLILDEPFSGLDPIGRKEFRGLLSELKQSGVTIFMSSHILGDVECLCDRAAIMAYGEIKAVLDLKRGTELAGGSYELVLRHGENGLDSIAALTPEATHENGLVRLRFKERAQAEEALRIALGAGVEIDSYQFVQGTLEDLFMKLVEFSEAG